MDDDTMSDVDISEQEIGGYRLYNRSLGVWHCVYEHGPDGKRKMITVERYDHWSRKMVSREEIAPAVGWRFERYVDPPWHWHMRKTYAKIGPAKAAYRYHYRQYQVGPDNVLPEDGATSPTMVDGRYIHVYGAFYESKIVPVVTVELDPIELPE